jgi:4-hydroxybenzoyl-CoA reductase subunit beta
MRIGPDFDVLRPADVGEAVAALARGGARPVGGGTDLLPNLRRGLVDAGTLVDLSALTALAGIAPEPGGGWRLGAAATLAALARHAELAIALPAVAQAAAGVAGPGHRSAATVAGNLCQDTRCVFYNQSAWWRGALGGCLKRGGDTCHVAPQGARCHAAYEGDLAPALIVHDAELEIAGPGGTRRLALADAYREDGAAHLALAPDELVVAVCTPAAAAGRVSGYHKARARGAMDFPLAGVAVAARFDGGRLAELAVAVSGTNPRPLRLAGTESLLGAPVDDAALVSLGRLVERQVTPMRSTVTAAHHRRRVAAVAAQRLLRALA